MAYNFTVLRGEIEATDTWLTQEYFGIRTGRAAPALLDSVRVEVYSTKMPLNQLANIAIEDARTLRITPYDMGQLKEIERAIQAGDLGVSVGSDDRGIRVSFPELTAERREQLAKLVKEKLEDARVRIRKAREEAWEDIQKQEKQKTISEDEKFRAKEEMQKIIDEGNRRLEIHAEKKEKEIRS
jgi:ribosome recycling factor